MKSSVGNIESILSIFKSSPVLKNSRYVFLDAEDSFTSLFWGHFGDVNTLTNEGYERFSFIEADENGAEV